MWACDVSSQEELGAIRGSLGFFELLLRASASLWLHYETTSALQTLEKWEKTKTHHQQNHINTQPTVYATLCHENVKEIIMEQKASFVILIVLSSLPVWSTVDYKSLLYVYVPMIYIDMCRSQPWNWIFVYIFTCLCTYLFCRNCVCYKCYILMYKLM